MPFGSYEIRRQHRVVADVGADIDDRHARLAEPFEHGGQVGFVDTGLHMLGDRVVGSVAKQLHVAHPDERHVVAAKLNREARGRKLMLDCAEHPANRRRIAQLSPARVIDNLADGRVVQRGVQQLNQFRVGKSTLRQNAA